MLLSTTQVCRDRKFSAPTFRHLDDKNQLVANLPSHVEELNPALNIQGYGPEDVKSYVLYIFKQPATSYQLRTTTSIKQHK